MPKLDDHFVRGRKDEILEYCLMLYKNKTFKEITIKDIGKLTSFTRTSIYTYFKTKEEIFLALFQREYELWTENLETIAQDENISTSEKFADAIAKSLESREVLLKLLSTNLYDMEDNSRIGNLVDFKRAYGASIDALKKCLYHSFPNATEDQVDSFVISFFPFMYGVYPYVFLTEKQIDAMNIAGVTLRSKSVYELVCRTILKLLKGVDIVE